MKTPPPGLKKRKNSAFTLMASHAAIWDRVLVVNDPPARCGFSKKVAAALTSTGVEYGTFDILGDEDIRSGLKEYSDWPTYPQLYVGGELVVGPVR